MVSQAQQERERPVAPGHHGSGVLQWLLVLLPLGLAFEQQQISFALMGWGCRHGSKAMVHAPAVVCLVLALGVGAWTLSKLARLGRRAPGDERSSDARARFMAVLALISAGFSAALIVAQWLPALMIDPCQR